MAFHRLWKFLVVSLFPFCVHVQQYRYEQYTPIGGQTVNGQLTLGENIGDLGGLSIAFEAYRISLDGKVAPVLDGFTGKQRLFLGWAQVWQSKYREAAMLRRLKSDPHSPPEFRVNGVVRNMDAWYEAFNVSEDHELYLPPEERVSILRRWPRRSVCRWRLMH